MRIRPLLPVLALLALGCTSSDSSSESRVRYTNAVVVADLDGDGRADIITGNGTYVEAGAEPGYASITLQTTPGTLGTPTRYSVGGDPAAIAVGDLNGDLRPDLVVANAASGTVSLLLQNPDHTFTLGATLHTGALTPLDVAIGDLNQDGRPDIAVATSGASVVQIFFQTATAGVFQATPTSLSLSGDPRCVAIADLNGDTIPDLAVGTTADVVSVCYQSLATAGTFAAPVNLATGARPVALKAVDLAGTGRRDLITANYRATTTGGGLTVIRQTAPGVFAAGVNFDVGDYYTAGIAVGDVDGDGHPDLVVACAGVAGDPGSVGVLLQNPASLGSFLPPDNYIGYSGPFGVALGDFNNDGLLDIVVADGRPYQRLQLSSAPGQFGPGTFIGY